jgi:hypothetical protein
VIRKLYMLVLVTLFALRVVVVSAESVSKPAGGCNENFRDPAAQGTRFGEAAKPAPAYLGARFEDSNDGAVKGAIIQEVFPDSAGAKAKLQVKDLVMAIGDVRVEGTLSVIQEIGRLSPYTQTTLTIIRDGKELKIPVTLGSRPNFSPLLRQAEPPRVPGGEFSLASGGSLGTDITIGHNLILPDGVGTIRGNFEQAWTGLLDVDLGNQAVLNVTGNAKLAGILHVRLANKELKAGDHFEVIKNAKSLQGEFGKVLLPPLSNGLEWKIIYDDVNNGVDFDGDGRHDVTLVVKTK